VIALSHPKVPPTSDPYEDDCCGSHLGEQMEVILDKDIRVLIEQHDSGIGPDWRISVLYQGSVQPLSLVTYVDDDGEFILEAKR
jgi:hypothetical protein